MKLNTCNDLIWLLVTKHILITSNFYSIKGIEFKAWLIEENIYYKGENRNKGEEEIISKAELLECIEGMKKATLINTNTIKKIIPNSMYRKRTPLIGLLFSAGILIK